MTMHKALLWKKLSENCIQCMLCAHTCKIKPDHYGFCGMRQNINGEFFTHAYGEVIANNVDPIEKKPLYHFLPGSNSYSISTIGCNFRCSFCQNWSISQISTRDRHVNGLAKTPQDIVTEAIDSSSRSISYTYTEPTVFFEYAIDIAKTSKNKDIRNIFVTNGFMTKEAIDYSAPYLDAVNIDLKSFNNEFYEKICKAKLQPVLDSIKCIKEKGIWVEITTLLVPGQNDSDDELNSIASFIAGVDPNIPWHISRFHPDYKYTDPGITSNRSIQNAVEIGKNCGLKYLYPGNVAVTSDTICPGCGKILIERSGFHVKTTINFKHLGKCSACGQMIAGVWA